VGVIDSAQLAAHSVTAPSVAIAAFVTETPAVGSLA